VFELGGCCLWDSLSQFHKHAIYPARALILRVFIRLSMDTPGSAKSVPGLSSCAFQPGSGWRGFTKFSSLERYGADLRRWPWIAAHSRVANKLVQHAAMALPGCVVGRPVLGWVCSICWARLVFRAVCRKLSVRRSRLKRAAEERLFWPLGWTRLAFSRRIPGLKRETWGTLRVSRTEPIWAPRGWDSACDFSVGSLAVPFV
jgi:hypothetical protein